MGFAVRATKDHARAAPQLKQIAERPAGCGRLQSPQRVVPLAVVGVPDGVFPSVFWHPKTGHARNALYGLPVREETPAGTTLKLP